MNPAWFHQLLGSDVTPVIENGVWRLHRADSDQFFADYLPRAFCKELEQASAIGWRAAVECGMKHLTPYVADYTRDYFFESYRSDFVEELGIGPRTTVLDLGAGWGFASQRCLEKGAFVVSTETAAKRLEFCATRFAQQGFDHRWVGIELDANRSFPFESAVFDAIIVSGLMEWLPCSAVGSPKQIQRKFVERCFEVLKPKGRLYLAIENRYWGKYFLGARDLHTLQRWTSILPRRAARAYSILTTHEDYRAWCYSLCDYIRQFKDVGYKTLTVIYPEPDYVQPKRVQKLIAELPLEQPQPWKDAYSGKNANRAASRFGRSFMFIATK